MLPPLGRLLLPVVLGGMFAVASVQVCELSKREREIELRPVGQVVRFAGHRDRHPARAPMANETAPSNMQASQLVSSSTARILSSDLTSVACVGYQSDPNLGEDRSFQNCSASSGMRNPKSPIAAG